MSSITNEEQTTDQKSPPSLPSQIEEKSDADLKLQSSKPRLGTERLKSPKRVDHTAWSLAAYEALDRAFIRAPRRVRGLVSAGKQEFIELYRKRSVEGTAVKWLKFHSACCFCLAYNQTELPPSPDGLTVPDKSLSEARSNGKDVHGPREDDGCFCPGKIQTAVKFIFQRAQAGGKRERDVAYDILMFKTGCPAVPPTFVKEALKAHALRLGNEHPLVEDIPEEYWTVVDELVDKVFRRKVLSLPDLCPSFRSSYNSSIKDGGAFAELLQEWQALWLQGHAPEFGYNDEDTLCWIKVVDPDGSIGLEPTTILLGRSGIRARCLNDSTSAGAFSFYLSLRSTLDLCSMYEPSPGVISEVRLPLSTCMLDSFQKYVDAKIKDRLAEPLDVSPVAILESLKVRIITKGLAPEYFRCLDYQKLMHHALAEHDVFSWIGRPITDSEWSQTFDPAIPSLLAGVRRMVSGDYEAATDNLNPKVSKHIWKRICLRVRRRDSTPLLFDPLAWDPTGSLPDVRSKSYSTEYLLGLKALTGHRLHYKTQEGMVSVRQQWGQLMGSPMSFPILCIANAAACLLAMGLRGSKVDQVMLRVNGDDCAFPASTDQIHDWERVTKSIGLVKSVGKNYVSNQFCIMNSELRVLHKSQEWVYKGWINQSLLTGRVRKGMNAGEIAPLSFMDVGPNLSRILRGIPAKFHDRITAVGIGFHAKVLETAPVMCSWYVPQDLGGLGLPCASVEAKVKGQPFEEERRTISAYVTSSAEIASRIPKPSREKGELGELIRRMRKQTPIAWRAHRITELNPLPYINPASGLSGPWNLASLAVLPGLTESWDAQEGDADNRKLARDWTRWVKPALTTLRSFQTAKGRWEAGSRDTPPPSCALLPMRYDHDHVCYSWENLVRLPYCKATREHWMSPLQSFSFRTCGTLLPEMERSFSESMRAYLTTHGGKETGEVCASDDAVYEESCRTIQDWVLSHPGPLVKELSGLTVSRYSHSDNLRAVIVN